MSFNHIFFNNEDKKSKKNRNKMIQIDSLYNPIKNLHKSTKLQMKKSNEKSNKKQLNNINKTNILPPINKGQNQSIIQQKNEQNYHQISQTNTTKGLQNYKTLYKMTTQSILKPQNISISKNKNNIISRTLKSNTKNTQIYPSNKQIIQSIEKNKQFIRTARMRKSFNQEMIGLIKNNNKNQSMLDKIKEKQITININVSNNNNNKNSNIKVFKQYTVNRLLGKGGFAQVFEVTHSQTQLKYAIKQYNLVNSWDCYKNQAKIGQYFFNNNNKIPEISKKNIVKYVQKFKINKKGYIVQQICGSNFSKVISQIKGTFYNKQRVYQVIFNPFYNKLKSRQYLNSIILQICNGVKLLNSNGFVHCDLKLQNILIQDKQNQQPLIKLIDFGSTFEYSYGIPKITITPQYMPPQLLSIYEKKNQHSLIQQKQYLQYDKIDIWSIGCILLQIFTGVPLWFKYKCKIQSYGKQSLQLSIFALTNRDYTKIIKRQKQFVQNGINHVSFTCREFQVYRKLLKKIFVFDVEKRINMDNLMKEVQNCI